MTIAGWPVVRLLLNELAFSLDLDSELDPGSPPALALAPAWGLAMMVRWDAAGAMDELGPGSLQSHLV